MTKCVVKDQRVLVILLKKGNVFVKTDSKSILTEHAGKPTVTNN